MSIITDIRVESQQLNTPNFTEVKDLVSWMGAIQAQDYTMAKWAVGIRLKSATNHSVEEAFNRGDILRTHVMRPTWHFVAAEDVRWMLELTAPRIKLSSISRDKNLGIDEKLYSKCNNLIQRILEGNKHLTREELSLELSKAGILVDSSRMIHFMMRAEVEGILCSGAVRGKKQTYALIEERVPPTKKVHKEEALAKLALTYFKSHSPASLQDFTWWSGLAVREARQAIDLIQSELISDKFIFQNYWVHQSFKENIEINDLLHFLPSFDEYLISYKDRTPTLELEHHTKAFTSNGIFRPIIMYNGKVIGAWKKSIKKGQLHIETTLFNKQNTIEKDLWEKAENAYHSFVLE